MFSQITSLGESLPTFNADIRLLSSCVNHHVITERVLLVQHLAANLAGVSLAVQNLVLVGHVAVLGRIPSSPTTEGTQPLFVSVCLATDFCNKSEAK